MARPSLARGRSIYCCLGPRPGRKATGGERCRRPAGSRGPQHLVPWPRRIRRETRTSGAARRSRPVPRLWGLPGSAAGQLRSAGAWSAGGRPGWPIHRGALSHGERTRYACRSGRSARMRVRQFGGFLDVAPLAGWCCCRMAIPPAGVPGVNEVGVGEPDSVAR